MLAPAITGTIQGWDPWSPIAQNDRRARSGAVTQSTTPMSATTPSRRDASLRRSGGSRRAARDTPDWAGVLSRPGSMSRGLGIESYGQ